MRFLGNVEAKVDAKGRVFIPAIFRREFQPDGMEQLVLRKDVFQDCLVLYPENVWNEQMDMMRSKLNRFDKQQQLVFRQFVSDVELLPIDSSGRILLPKRYLDKVSIDRDVKFIGMGDTIEVWNATATEQPFMGADDFAAALQNLMKTAEE